jgi:capsid protein
MTATGVGGDAAARSRWYIRSLDRLPASSPGETVADRGAGRKAGWPQLAGCVNSPSRERWAGRRAACGNAATTIEFCAEFSDKHTAFVILPRISCTARQAGYMTAPDPLAEAPKKTLADWGPSIHVSGMNCHPCLRKAAPSRTMGKPP